MIDGIANEVVAGRSYRITKDQGIQWAPISSGERLNFIGGSFDQVRKAMIDAFGPFPIHLSKEHLPFIRGMVVANECSAYKELFNALSQFGRLEITEL